MKSRPANTSLYRMTYVIGIFALARSKAVFTPVSLRTIFFASGTSESRLAFTSAIYRVTCCIIMTIAFVSTIRTKSPWRTRKTTLRPMPTSRTSTFSIYMIALKILYIVHMNKYYRDTYNLNFTHSKYVDLLQHAGQYCSIEGEARVLQYCPKCCNKSKYFE